jgi:hypothetical protein
MISYINMPLECLKMAGMIKETSYGILSLDPEAT